MAGNAASALERQVRGHVGGSSHAWTSTEDTTACWALQRVLSGSSGHAAGVNWCAWSPDGSHLASASEDETVRVWDAVSGREVATLEGHTDQVYSCAWSPVDGTRLASASVDKTVRVWGRGLHSFPIQRNLSPLSTVYPTYLAHERVLELLKLSSNVNECKPLVWDVHTGRQVALLEGHGCSVISCTWSPNGTLLAGASAGAYTRSR